MGDAPGRGDDASDGLAGLSYGALERGPPLGVGGAATVYAATAPDGTPLALKEPHVDHPDALARFERR